MSGWEPPENLTKKMLTVLSGGPKIKQLMFIQKDDARAVRSSS